jgi:hypothetical protein
MLTKADEENYGSELLDMSRRAALDALGPELNALRAENQQLRGMAQRAQHGEIERALNRSVPTWREIYQDPRFADWLSQPGDYSGSIRSQLLRSAVANGDSARVAAIYRGFSQGGHHAPGQQRSYQSRSPATGGKPIYSRDQIRRLYEQRARGAIPDSRWAPLEADIVKAASEGRVTSIFDKFGNEMRLR